MLRRIALLGLALLLSACESTQVNHDFDASRDFASYRSWAWKEPGLQYRPNDPRIQSDLTEQRIRQAVAEQLDQRGLRQAPPGSKADLQVQTYLIIDNRQQQISNYYGGAWGSPWNGYWGAPMYNETRSVDYQVATLQIDLLDGKDGRLVWRGSAEQIANPRPSPAERSAEIRESVGKVLSSYPPR
ncbi:MAG: DUF4136 domain-containing protein [Pseudomonadota bacterium]